MKAIFGHNWILRITVSTMSIFFSCGTNGNSNNIESIKIVNTKSHFDGCDELKEFQPSFIDTIFVKTADELKSQLKNNRVLILGNQNYKLESTLQLDSIENLKIVGNKTSRLMIDKQNSTVLKLSNSHNFWIENVTIGHSTNQGHIGEQGIVRIEHSSNVNIKSCKILGAGTFGLIVKDVCGLTFENSEITKCSALIFELNKSKKIEFKNTKFQDNRLAISVLGGFTNATKEVTFTNCEFLNNQPEMSGNPAFNFDNNYQNFEEKIFFKNCTFKNNKGYKWYSDKIKLENCKIDSTDFIGLQKHNLKNKE